ncbi:MAG: DUF819 family protein [Oscillospiraceae bacterium]|nr:DUF819 family protein [Oscillospiraceae bacterium]
MIITVLQLIAIFAVPLLILRWRERGLIRTFGTIAMAYFWGIVVAVAVWLLNKLGLDFHLNADVGQISSYACIGLAIPLLMFSTDLGEVRRLAKPVLISFASLLIAVMAVVLVVGRTMGAAFPWGRQLSAMATGMYTGGSPNFNAVGVILAVPADVIAVGNLGDMIVGTVFYIFILLAAKPLLGRLLDRRARKGPYMKGDGETANVDALEWHGFSRGIRRNLLLALGCVAVGGAAGFVIWKIKGGVLTDPLVPAVMIAGTVLGLALSFVRSVREVPENAAAGHYLILVFSFALASSLDLTTLRGSLIRTVALLGVITVCSFAIHALFCRAFRIDADCAIVTMTAGLYGPAFIPAVTKQLRNDALTAPGLICGALGYAVGTLLGTGIFYLL